MTKEQVCQALGPRRLISGISNLISPEICLLANVSQTTAPTAKGTGTLSSMRRWNESINQNQFYFLLVDIVQHPEFRFFHCWKDQIKA